MPCLSGRGTGAKLSYIVSGFNVLRTVLACAQSVICDCHRASGCLEEEYHRLLATAAILETAGTTSPLQILDTCTVAIYQEALDLDWGLRVLTYGLA